MRVAFLSTLLLTSACGDDSLGGAFVPDPPDNTPPENVTDLAPGDYGFAINASYRQTVDSGGGAGPEQQTAATLCIRVTAVADTALPEHAEAEQTTLTGQVKLNGSSQPSIDVSDSINGSVDPAAVDASLAPLWIKATLYPTLTTSVINSPTSKTFTTEQAPTPATGLEGFPFIELRKAGEWLGISSAATKLKSAVQQRAGLSASDLTDPMKIDVRELGPLSTCADLTDFQGCGNQTGCSWSFVSNACEARPTIKVAWRETGDSSFPTEMQGDALLHFFEATYAPSGRLLNASEYVVPDLDPSASLDADGGLRCESGEPCLVATVTDDDEFEFLECDF